MTHAIAEQSFVADWCVDRPRIRALLLGLLSGLLFIGAFPPIGWWGCSFLAPVPMFVLAVRPVIRPHRAGFYAAIGMMPAWWWLHQWIGEISMLGLYPLMVYLSLYTWAFVWIGHRAVNRWGCAPVALAVAWVGVEFARGAVIWTGYPWYFIGHPMIDPLGGLLAAPARVGGVYLVSFFVALIAAGVTEAVGDKRSWIRVSSLVLGVGIVWIAMGVLVSLAVPIGRPMFLRVGVVQPNVPQDNRMDWTPRQRIRDWSELRTLSYRVARMDPTPEVIIWPEGFVPGWTLDPKSLETERNGGVAWMLTPKGPDDVPELDLPSAVPATMVVDEILTMQGSLGIPMIVGSVAYDNLVIRQPDGSLAYTHDAMYNSAFVLLDGEPQPVWYDKLHLTPFGEVMPYISAWPWLEQQLLGFGANGMAFVLSEGKEARVLTIPTADGEVMVATPICFEATMPAVCRRLVFDGGQRRASLMVNMTNDGWFGDWTPGRRGHEMMARWRCVELATPMVRCANTGISGGIDHRGQLLDIEMTGLNGSPITQPDRQAGGFVATIELARGSTVYARIGDLFGWILLGLTVLGGFVVKKPRSARSTGSYAENTGTIKVPTPTEPA